MGMDQHRQRISAEWIDTITGEISRARIAPADRTGVRRFLAGFRGCDLEVALEATTGWRFREQGRPMRSASGAARMLTRKTRQSVRLFRRLNIVRCIE